MLEGRSAATHAHAIPTIIPTRYTAVAHATLRHRGSMLDVTCESSRPGRARDCETDTRGGAACAATQA
jgi:hypothetical protein